MKNLIYVVIVAIAAFLAYKFLIAKDVDPSSLAPSAPELAAVTADSSTTSEMDKSSPPTSVNTENAFSSLMTESAAGADVFILEPGNGSAVSSPVTVKFGITNMAVAKAGDNIEFSGHHHLLINVSELPDLTVPLPATDQIVHFGGAQTETTINLEPGEHTLQLVLGNYLHIPHTTPVISKKITITVE